MMNKLITALIIIALSFNASASEQCSEESKNIIRMQEKSLNYGTARGSSAMAYARTTIGTTGVVYALVNSATGLGFFSFVIFIAGSMDIYINSKNDEQLDKLKERLCT